MKDLNTMNSTPTKTNNLLDHVSRIASAYIASHKTPLEDISVVITWVPSQIFKAVEFVQKSSIFSNFKHNHPASA